MPTLQNKPNTHNPSCRSALQQLTPAERLVAAMAVQGQPYKSIARSLGKSPATVRNQLHAVYQKLGVGNRTALLCALDGEHRLQR